MAFLHDTWVVFSRSMRLSARNPIWLVIGLVQPILYLTLFGPLLGEVVTNSPGFPAGDAWQIFVPGLLVQLCLFGSAFVGFGLIAEYRSGVFDRQRVTPASRSALLAGRVLRDVVVLMIQTTMLLAAAVLFGLRAPIGGVLLSILLVAGLGAAFAALSYSIALRIKNEDALAPMFNGLAIPILLLSGILLPMSLAPLWLSRLSDLNPLKHVVDGMRAFFAGDIASSTGLWGVVATVAVMIGCLWFGALTFRRESA